MLASGIRLLFSPVALLTWDFNSVMPVVGLILIFLCFFAYFFPNARTLREKNQVFEGAGVRMQISLLTVFVIMGFALSLSSVWLQYKGYIGQADKFAEAQMKKDDEIKRLNTLLEDQRKLADKVGKFDMSILLRPKIAGADNSLLLRPKDWRCEYRIEGQPATPQSIIRPDINKGPTGNTLKVTLEDITRDTHLEFIKLINVKTGKVWSTSGTSPFNGGNHDLSEDTDDDPNGEN